MGGYMQDYLGKNMAVSMGYWLFGTNSFNNSNFRPGCFLSESEKDRVHGRGGRPSILKDTAIPTVFHHFGPPKKKRRAFENIDETPENLEVHVIFDEIVTLFLKLIQSGTTNCH